MLPVLAAIALAATPQRGSQGPGWWMVGIRVGFAFPFGQIGRGLEVHQNLWGEVPLEGELGFRPRPELTLAVFGAYGAGFFTPVRNRNVWGQLVRFGVEALWEPQPLVRVSPWFGVALTGEWLEYRRGQRDGTETLKVAIDALGLAPIDLQAGLTWHATRDVGAGPYLEFSAGRFGDVRAKQYGYTYTYAPAWHEMLVVGFAAQF